MKWISYAGYEDRIINDIYCQIMEARLLPDTRRALAMAEFAR
jgi:hypothetical protein